MSRRASFKLGVLTWWSRQPWTLWMVIFVSLFIVVFLLSWLIRLLFAQPTVSDVPVLVWHREKTSSILFLLTSLHTWMQKLRFLHWEFRVMKDSIIYTRAGQNMASFASCSARNSASLISFLIYSLFTSILLQLSPNLKSNVFFSASLFHATDGVMSFALCLLAMIWDTVLLALL